jgi:hypothetical protein
VQEIRRANEAEFLGDGSEVTQPAEIEIHFSHGSQWPHAFPALGGMKSALAA